MKFHLSGQVTISISTVVEAASATEAYAIGARREMAAIHVDGTYEKEDYWLPGEELDGAPTEISVEPKDAKETCADCGNAIELAKPEDDLAPGAYVHASGNDSRDADLDGSHDATPASAESKSVG